GLVRLRPDLAIGAACIITQRIEAPLRLRDRLPIHLIGLGHERHRLVGRARAGRKDEAERKYCGDRAKLRHHATSTALTMRLAGKVTVTHVPLPSTLVMVSVASWSSATRFTKASPRPAPS